MSEFPLARLRDCGKRLQLRAPDVPGPAWAGLSMGEDGLRVFHEVLHGPLVLRFMAGYDVSEV